MLPFLKKKNEVSVSVPSDHVTRESDEESDASDYSGLEAAADDLIEAIKSGDSKAAAQALQAAVEMCLHSDSEEAL